MQSAALNRRAREARAWLMDACFPLWCDAGFDGSLFRENLSLQHKPVESEVTRVRVQARQTFVFATAAMMNWNRDKALDLVREGVEILAGPARREDGLIGRTLKTSDLTLKDDIADLYDTAFALMALAVASRVLDEPAWPLTIAGEILASVDTHMKDTSSGGYAEWLPAPDTRLQNPHMHLFEACLVLHTADPDGGFLARAGELLSLFQTRFIANKSSLLTEQFQSDWTPQASSHTFEPGHHFEWVWLLTQHAKQIGAYPPPETVKLYDFAVSACDDAGRVPLGSDLKGKAIDPARRAWPHAEALKAHLIMMVARSDSADCARAIQSFDILMDEYLTPEGGWIDHYDAEGLPVATTIPASTGYHVVLALTELIRVTGV